MTYEEKIPDFALQPAKSEDPDPDKNDQDDGFDPTPYDRLLVPEPIEGKKEEAIYGESGETEEIFKEKEEKPEPVVLKEEPAEDLSLIHILGK